MDNIINDTLKLINTISNETVNLTKKIVEQYNSSDSEENIIIKLLAIIDNKNERIKQLEEENDKLKEQLETKINKSTSNDLDDTETIYSETTDNTYSTVNSSRDSCSTTCSCEKEEWNDFEKYDKWCISKSNDYSIIMRDKINRISCEYGYNYISSLDYECNLDGYNKLFENEYVIIYAAFQTIDQLLNNHFRLLKNELEQL
jgi:hypothetical protein